MSIAERQAEAAKAFVEGYNAFTIEGLLARRSKDCIHRICPASLKVEPRDNEAYADFYRKIVPIMRNYKLTVLKTINDPVARTVVLHTRGSADTPVGPYANEYIFFLKMSEHGDELVEVDEMVDSAFVQEWFPKLAAHMEKHPDEH